MEEKTTKYASQIKYAQKNVSQLSIKLNKNTDADILEHLSKTDNIQGYLKDLIRADISKNK